MPVAGSRRPTFRNIVLFTIASAAVFFPFFIARPQQTGSHVLWRIDSDLSTVYLLGSIHVARRTLYPLDDAIESAFRRSDVLVLETDIDKLNPAMFQNYYANSTYDSGDSIDNHISEETRRLLDETLQKLGIQKEGIIKFKPWFLSAFLSQHQMQKLGYEPAWGIDRHFLTQARGHKRIEGLETPQSQIALLMDLRVSTDDNQEGNLVYSLNEILQTEEQMERITNSWRIGDTAALESIMFQMYNHQYYSSIVDRLIYQRNINMAAKISRFLGNRKTYFVIVGSAHLLGDRGIPALLAQRGFRLKKL